MNGPALVRRQAPTPVHRPPLTGGLLPVREGLAADHDRLVRDRDYSVRAYIHYHDHDAEIQYARAQDRLDAFEKAHPEFESEPPQFKT